MTAITMIARAAAGSLVLATAAVSAQAQTPYSTSPYSAQQSPYGTQTQPGDVLQALLGQLFGTTQTVDSEWSRGRRPLNTGRASFEARLDASVRDGTVSRYQADSLRTDYAALVQLEARYGSDGRFTTQERSELGQRYRELTERLQSGDNGYPGNGYPGGGYDDWRSLVEGRAAFDARVETALRERDITRTEATRLRSDYAALVQVEAGYQRNGIDARERADLQARLDVLNQRVGDGGGYGGNDNRSRITRIEASIVAGERSGAVSRYEAERLRTELGDLTRLDTAYAENGLNADESSYLSRRFGELEVRVRDTRR